MQKVLTSLPGVWELRPAVFGDARGYFLETYHRAKFEAFGITETFIQDNQSCSSKDTLRGLHYQLHRPQAKLCRVVAGEVLDVTVDVRVGSPHFGKWTGIVLSAKAQNQVYIPVGFAHGYLALTETVQFLYKCSDFYDPTDEYGIMWNDPAVAIAWGVSNPRVSDKDSKYTTLAVVPREHLPQYRGE